MMAKLTLNCGSIRTARRSRRAKSTHHAGRADDADQQSGRATADTLAAGERDEKDEDVEQRHAHHDHGQVHGPKLRGPHRRDNRSAPPVGTGGFAAAPAQAKSRMPLATPKMTYVVRQPYRLIIAMAPTASTRRRPTRSTPRPPTTPTATQP